MSEPVEADKLFDPNGPGPATSTPAPVHAEPEMTGVGTLMRLAVGGVSLALNAVRSATEPPEEGASPSPQERAGAEGGPAGDRQQEQVVDSALRHVLIGAAFEAGDRVDRRVSAAFRRAREATSPAAGWARQSRLTAPARGSYNRLAARSEARLKRWQARGAAEETQGRAMLGTALDRTVDTSLDYVVDSQQVQGLMDELVAAESLALSQKIFVELRGRSVSADLYDAHLIRSVLKHPVPEIPPLPRALALVEDAPARPANLRGRAAGSVTRLAAFITDIIIISILIRAAGWFLEDVRPATGIKIYLPEITEAVGSTAPTQLTVLAGLLIATSYVLFFWTMAGQTPGKALLGLRIVTRDGGRLSFWRSLVRFFGYWLSSLFFGAGFLWASIDNYREGWHDKLAGTTVVYAWDAQPDGESLATGTRGSDEP